MNNSAEKMVTKNRFITEKLAAFYNQVEENYKRHNCICNPDQDNYYNSV